MPIALAVLRLIASSILVGCYTGISATPAPRSTLTIWRTCCRKLESNRGPQLTNPPSVAQSGHWKIAGMRAAMVRSIIGPEYNGDASTLRP